MLYNFPLQYRVTCSRICGTSSNRWLESAGEDVRLPSDMIHVENRFHNVNQRKPSLLLVPVSTKGITVDHDCESLNLTTQ